MNKPFSWTFCCVVGRQPACMPVAFILWSFRWWWLGQLPVLLPCHWGGRRSGRLWMPGESGELFHSVVEASTTGLAGQG